MSGIHNSIITNNIYLCQLNKLCSCFKILKYFVGGGVSIMEDSKVLVVSGSCFCDGVRAAIKEVKDVLANRGDAIVFSVHGIVHNENVVGALEALGLNVEEGTEYSPPRGSIMLGTAHGLGPITRAKYEKLGCRVISTTCPKVVRFQRDAAMLLTMGYHLVIVGDPNHREVESVLEYLLRAKSEGNASGTWQVISGSEEASAVSPNGLPVALMAQTTTRASAFDEAAQRLSDRFDNVRVVNTLCPSVERRVENARKMARRAEVMIVVGSPDSNNSKELASAVKVYCQKVVFVRDIVDLKDTRIFSGARIIGIVGGASTDPVDVERIREAVEHLLLKRA